MPATQVAGIFLLASPEELAESSRGQRPFPVKGRREEQSPRSRALYFVDLSELFSRMRRQAICGQHMAGITSARRYSCRRIPGKRTMKYLKGLALGMLLAFACQGVAANPPEGTLRVDMSCELQGMYLITETTYRWTGGQWVVVKERSWYAESCPPLIQ